MNGLISTGTIVTCWQASTGGVMPIWRRRVSASAVSLSAKSCAWTICGVIGAAGNSP